MVLLLTDYHLKVSEKLNQLQQTQRKLEKLKTEELKLN
jgi:hypothetical protein